MYFFIPVQHIKQFFLKHSMIISKLCLQMCKSSSNGTSIDFYMSGFNEGTRMNHSACVIILCLDIQQWPLWDPKQ